MIYLKDVARSCLNIPYQYGGKNPLTGFDCSGLCEWLLMSLGIDPPGVANAQALHDYFVKPENHHATFESVGALIFYGKSLTQISHVSMMINDYQVIEAGGGDSTTTSIEEAKRRGACVRIKPIHHRQGERVAVILPKFPEWAFR